jgi:hypothetical protein
MLGLGSIDEMKIAFVFALPGSGCKFEAGSTRRDKLKECYDNDLVLVPVILLSILHDLSRYPLFSYFRTVGQFIP